MKYRSKVPLFGRSINMHQFLNCVPVNHVVDVIITTCKQLLENSETFSPPVTSLVQHIGHDVMTQYHVHNKMELDTRFMKDLSGSYSQYLDWFCQPEGDHLAHR